MNKGQNEEAAVAGKPAHKLRRWILLLALAALTVGILLVMRSRGLSLNLLLNERDKMLAFVRGNSIVAGLLFILAYILVVAFSIPGATVLTLLGGFFFGPFLGTLLVNIGATTGALLIFIAARYLLRDALMLRYSQQLQRLNEELRKNGASYLLTLRFIPLFPFFLINLLAGLTPVSWITYAWTTAVGIIPGSFVYTLLGSSGATMESAKDAFSPTLIAGLVLLGVVSLIPVLLQKLRKKKDQA
ncbi:MAG: TVP38/TMEM64 family protein [Spirochaetes bacterium]|nr:TVP38/TMEM64 family protein [Spirochaetota bacterium]